jgi:hypothetical protein
MSRFHPRYGQGKLGCILWVIALAVFIMICLEVVPVKIRTAELYDFMENTAMRAGRTKPAILKKQIARRAKDLELPVTEKNVTVEMRGGRIRIRCKYTVPLEFPGYTYNWEFDQLVDRPVFDI